jgi:soluble lytic murein transglycosylase-like protein
MSTLTIEPTTTQSGPAAASRRVQQLQALVAQAASGSTASFAAALQAASGASSTASQDTPSAETASAPTAGQTTSAAYAAPTSYVAPAAYASPSVAGTPAQMTYAPASEASLTPATGAAPAGVDTGSSTYDAAIAQAAARNGIEPALLHGLIQQESGFDPNAHSSSGALGLTQLMPGTASSLGVSDPLDPTQSIEGGARYLSKMLAKFGGNTADALAAYNAGPGAVSRYGGVPPYSETQEYVNKVLGYAAAYSRTLPATGAGSLTAATSTATSPTAPDGIAPTSAATATTPGGSIA